MPFILLRSKVKVPPSLLSLALAHFLACRLGLLRVIHMIDSQADRLTDSRSSQPPTVKRIPPKNYAENFVFRPGKLRIARTK
jgi:hypothetical protein